MKVAFVFPGQGSQDVGMGKALAESSPRAAAIWREADEALGFSLSRLCFEGPADQLALTANTQPAVLTASVAAAAVSAERGLAPDLVAGHSLGEYSALVVGGAIAVRGGGQGSCASAASSCRTRCRSVSARWPRCSASTRPLPRRSAPSRPGGRWSAVANINAPGQVVIAGHKTAVERAVKAAAARGGRKSVMLPVSAPFHSALMKPAADRLAAELTGVHVVAPRIPVVRNVDAGVTTTADEVKPFLVQQVASPVRWTDCVERLGARARRSSSRSAQGES